jgi:S-DNA-T family DNA segregation ATPase FtsK/SpoIIIE
MQNNTGRRSQPLASPAMEALLEGDDAPVEERPPGEETTRALPRTADGIPELFTGLLRQMRPTPPVVPVLDDETTAKVSEGEGEGLASAVPTPPAPPTSGPPRPPALPTGAARPRPAGATPARPAGEAPLIAAGAPVAAPAEGAPRVEMQSITTAEINAIFPPEMSESANGKAAAALAEASAAAPSRVTSEGPAFADFSAAIDTSRATAVERPVELTTGGVPALAEGPGAVSQPVRPRQGSLFPVALAGVIAVLGIAAALVLLLR